MTTVDNSVASTGYSPNPYVCGDTKDKIFILSYSEAKNSSYGLDSAKGRISKATDYASARGYSVEYYWLRSPNSVSDDCAGYVYYDGYFSSYNDDSIRNDIRVDYGEEGVRPAFRIKIS